jgi:quinohemoprotein ethanol dehydrogenase
MKRVFGRKWAPLGAIAAAALGLASCALHPTWTGDWVDPAKAEAAPAAAAEPSGPAAVHGDAMRAIDAPENVGDWMSYGRGWDEQRYSPLDQINQGNVEQLGLAWYADLGTFRGIESTPLVIDGILYNVSSFNVVTAYDGKTGRELWTYDPKVAREWARLACCGPSSRGIAAWNGKIYIGALDGRLIAIDAKTGTEVWARQTVDPDWAYSITGAPRVFDGKVVIGNGGADYGVRGFVVAYDAETGKQLWKFYTVPGDPSKGPDGEASDSVMPMAAQTWTGEWWKGGGGGTAWDSIVYDPDLNLVYIGTGNGSPHMQHFRSPGGGDNLFLCSIVAVDADNGEYRWHYQMVPAEEWDYTCTQPMMLADLEIGGRERKVLMQAPKNGFFYVLDRITGKVISGKSYVPNTWASGLDPETGRPLVYPEARNTRTPHLMTPGAFAAHSWYPMAYHPKTGLVYFSAQVQADVVSILPDDQYNWVPFRSNSGRDYANRSDPELARKLQAEANAMETAFLLAWDPVNQREVWRVTLPFPGSGGVLATAGNLLFEGTTNKNFAAFSPDSGELLWQMPVDQIPVAGPITYMIDGEQYIAVNAGWHGAPSLGASRVPGGIQTAQSRLLVFKLGGTAKLPPMPPPSALPRPPFLRASEAQVIEGRAVFAETCRSCHGDEARGGLKDLRYMSSETHAEFRDIVLGGIRSDKGMASFKDILTENQVDAIHAYLIARANEDWADDATKGN